MSLLFLCQIVGVVTTLLMSVGGLPLEPHPKHSSICTPSNLHTIHRRSRRLTRFFVKEQESNHGRRGGEVEARGSCPAVLCNMATGGGVRNLKFFQHLYTEQSYGLESQSLSMDQLLPTLGFKQKTG